MLVSFSFCLLLHVLPSPCQLVGGSCPFHFACSCCSGVTLNAFGQLVFPPIRSFHVASLLWSLLFYAHFCMFYWNVQVRLDETRMSNNILPCCAFVAPLSVSNLCLCCFCHCRVESFLYSLMLPVPSSFLSACLFVLPGMLVSLLFERSLHPPCYSLQFSGCIL